MSDFKAYGNRILIDVSQSIPGKTKGGIQLPENTRIDPIGSGIVKSVGPGVMTAFGWDAPQIKIGDEVIFERARAQVIDRENFICSLWAGEVIGVKRDQEIKRLVEVKPHNNGACRNGMAESIREQAGV